MTADRIDIVDVVDSGDGLCRPHAMGYLRSELRMLFHQLEREYLEGLLDRSRTRVNHQSIGFDLMRGIFQSTTHGLGGPCYAEGPCYGESRATKESRATV